MVLQEEKHMLGHPAVTRHLGDTVKVGTLWGSTTAPVFLGWQGTKCVWGKHIQSRWSLEDMALTEEAPDP